MSTKTFQVVKNLSVRDNPGLNTNREEQGLTAGMTIEVDPNSRREVDGFIWWQHSAGWSAERKADGSAVFMEAITPETPTTTEPITPDQPAEPEEVYFAVKTRVKIRMSAGTSGITVEDTYLEPNTVVTVKPNSRVELNGFVWWQHDLGWSASQSADGSTVFLEQVDSPDAVPTASTEPEEPEKTDAPVAVKGSRTGTFSREFRVMLNVNVRDEPGLHGDILPDQLQSGVIIEVDPDSRTEKDGWVWWQHQFGWSAGSNLDSSRVFFGDPNAPVPGSAESMGSSSGVAATDGTISIDSLPQRNALFTRLPVELNLTAWVQYFGNTNFAYTDGGKWGYDGFSQGLHSGFDFGNGTNNYHGAIPVYAGVSGTFVRNNRYGVAVQSGEYLVIYQHVSETNSYVKNNQVWPHTQIGILDPSYGTNRHLHLEVRYKGERYIINPLLLMPEAMRNSLLTNFTRYDMSSANGWSKWQTPLDQPIIVLGGPVIGPRA